MMMAESGQSLGKWSEDTCAIGHCSSSWDTVECDGEILFLWSFHSKEVYGASLVAPMVKNLPECRRCRFNPWVGKIPWRREWLPIPVFLSGEFHWQRSLVGYSLWGHKELDMTEQLTHTPLFIAAPFTIARTWKQSKCLSTEEWIKKRWCGKLLSHKKE